MQTPSGGVLDLPLREVASRSYLSLMRTVGLKVLKNRLSEYIRIVGGGEVVLVTDRDRIVAELRPPQGRGPLTSDALLAEAMRQGWLAAPLVVREGAPPRAPVAPLAELLSELRADREDR